MAKLIDIKCPKCSAPVHIDADATSVTCRYCGGTSAIERGRPTVAPNNHAPIQSPVHAAPRAITWVISGVVTVGIMVGVAGSVLRVRSTPTTYDASGRPVASPDAPDAAAPRMHLSDPPMLVDVNGDGVLDVVGNTRQSGSNDAIAAFNGNDGTLLWRGPLLTKDAVASGALRGVAHGRVLAVDSLGKVQAFDLATGNPAWSALLGEQARKICEGTQVIVIETTDDARHGLDPVSGKKSEVDPKAPCTPVYSTERDVWPGYRIIGWPDMEANGLPEMRDVEGMSAHRALVPTGPGPKFMLGQRDKGTPVPMIAAIGDKRKVLWKEVVPGVDPLTAEVDTLGMEAAVHGGKLVVPYALKDSDAGSRIACFDIATGQRLWDVQALKRMANSHGIAVSPERVFVTGWFESAMALSLETGEFQYQIGGD